MPQPWRAGATHNHSQLVGSDAQRLAGAAEKEAEAQKEGTAKETEKEGLNTYEGTPFFMAPEMLRQQPHDHRADIWAYACVAECMVTHHMVYHLHGALQDGNDDQALIDRVQAGPPRPAADRQHNKSADSITSSTASSAPPAGA